MLLFQAINKTINKTGPVDSERPDAPLVSATVSVPASAGSLTNPVNITGELTFSKLVYG